METFLTYVAQDLMREYPNDLSKIVVVFPNKRASLFMNECLAEMTSQPIWSPAYMTISELFRSASSCQSGDKISLICELYRTYLEVTGKCEADESLDHFYSWGEILLADFDDADKNLVDVDKLFRNLRELKALENDDYLTEEQKEALRLFFEKFQFEKTPIQQRFTRLWDSLHDLYTRFRTKMLKEKTLYEGALYRNVLENFDENSFSAQCYAFVGFNVLNKVEEELFTRLHQLGKARFYWDYDEHYLPSQDNKSPMEAGFFLKKNIRKFGNALDPALFKAMSFPKEIEYISASTENAQVRYITPWLKEHLTEKENETAIVLCNENLLESTLHALPPEVKELNITMGFPLCDTPIFSFIQNLCNLQMDGYSAKRKSYHYDEIKHILLHPYTQQIYPEALTLLQQLTLNRKFYPLIAELQGDGIRNLLFPSDSPLASSSQFLEYLIKMVEIVGSSATHSPTDKQTIFTPLNQEALFQCYTLLNRLLKLVADNKLTVKPETLIRLLYQLMGSTNIPFHGEPANGLQIMGVLETRNLDFSHLMMLSVNEGILPHSGNEASFIPYNLRKAFGMTLIEQKIAVYAYYFYRLIQRAKHVTLLYNNNTDGLQKGEMSRFMLQLLVEHPSVHTLVQKSLKDKQTLQNSRPISITKNERIMNKLHRYSQTDEKGFISPTALNNYIDCPLKFYFKYIAHLDIKENITDEIDSAMFGTIFHRSAELIYLNLTRLSSTIRRKEIEQVLKNELYLQEIIDFAFKENLFLIGQNEKEEEVRSRIIRETAMPELSGTQIITRHVILRYIRQLLQNDLILAPFTICGLEKNVRIRFAIHQEGKELFLHLGGNIDRMDEYTDENGNRVLRIIDYKTGGTPQKTTDIQNLFIPSDKRAYHILQAFYYAMQVNENNLNPHGLPISPAIFYIQKAASEEYRASISIGIGKNAEQVSDFENQYGEEYRQWLRTTLEELFNPNIPFTQCESNHPCEWCDFKKICNR